MARYRIETKKRTVSKQRMLVLCEGKTEKKYLEGLKQTLPRQAQRDIDIDIKDAKESEPVKAIQEFEHKLKKAKDEKQPYTESWVVFDDDNRELCGVFGKLTAKKRKYVYNSIAVEFWFLLHYTNSKRQFNDANEVIKELTKAGHPQFSKTDSKAWKKLQDKYDVAKKRAIAIQTQHKKDGNEFPACKPYTNMYELVDTISGFAV